MKKKEIEKLIHQAIEALSSEIEAVRKKPSSDVLFNGKKTANGSGESGTDYKFETHQASIKYAEEIKARSDGSEWIVKPVMYDEGEVTLRFPESAGKEISQLYVEWENDFILRRTVDQLLALQDAKPDILQRIESLFDPKPHELPDTINIESDNFRNRAQQQAIEKAMSQRTLFVWGPPGTGKTETLGFIIANYLMKGKSVLFASNTNRAVDVGFLSTLSALDQTGSEKLKKKCTRFGEAALESQELQNYLFEAQIAEKIEKKREAVSEWIDLLRREREITDSISKRLQDGKKASGNQELELKLIHQKIESSGGKETIEEQIEEQSSLNEAMELKSNKLIATTLAKVCTSDLFQNLDFDAVVIDEGSMASLSFMIVLAARAKKHIVTVGDPMQLPPIALTDDREASDFLQRDIFTTVSGAGTTEGLFRWHDQNLEITQFFDTQYRLAVSLAEIISSVFYEGRLRSDVSVDRDKLRSSDSTAAFHLVDTSRYGAFITQNRNERGFKPANIIHQQVIERLLGNMIAKGISPKEIGVIVPFRSPVYDIRNRINESGFRDVEVGTIHTFQGREKPYIIFDTVISGEKQYNGYRHYSVRLFDEEKNGLSVPRLLNVAFSRSKKELVVIADMEHVKKVYGKKFLYRLLSRFEK